MKKKGINEKAEKVNIEVSDSKRNIKTIFIIAFLIINLINIYRYLITKFKNP